MSERRQAYAALVVRLKAPGWSLMTTVNDLSGRTIRDVPRGLGWIDEDSRADDPAHDQHGGVEGAQPADQAVRTGLAAAHAASMTSRMV